MSPSGAGFGVVLVVDVGVAHLDPSSPLLRLDSRCCFHFSLHERSLSLCDGFAPGEEVEAAKMRKRYMNGGGRYPIQHQCDETHRAGNRSTRSVS